MFFQKPPSYSAKTNGSLKWVIIGRSNIAPTFGGGLLNISHNIERKDRRASVDRKFLLTKLLVTQTD